MNKLKWTETNSVSVRECDEQHKNLFDIINRLMLVKDTGTGQKEIFNVLSELIRYSDYHFSTEFNYMIDYDYPDFMSHHEQHQYYLKKVNGFLKGFEEGKETLSDDILNFLKNWWV